MPSSFFTDLFKSPQFWMGLIEIQKRSARTVKGPWQRVSCVYNHAFCLLVLFSLGGIVVTPTLSESAILTRSAVRQQFTRKLFFIFYMLAIFPIFLCIYS